MGLVLVLAAASLAGQTRSKEYIRLGGRVLAVENSPKITSGPASAPSSNSAIITWTTDVAADSQVEYGTTTAYGQSTALDPALTQPHNVAISGLAAAATYHYRVKSRGSNGLLSTSGDYQFTTPSGCSYSINPTSRALTSAAEATGSLTVTTQAGCTWTAVSNNPAWITVTSGASGTGTGTVGYWVAANPDLPRAPARSRSRARPLP